jgi:hypothetical protein
MSNPNVRCALEGCGLRRRDHLSWQAAQLTGQLHAFVEPAPQPPADAATHAYRGRGELCHFMLGRPGEQQIQCDQPPLAVCHAREEKPAAPPVSGDGDEAVVREIANRHVSAGNCCFTNTMVLVREALERGRALGARDEREAIEDQLRTQADEHEHAADAYPVVAYEQSLRAKCLRDEADVITKKGKAQ